MTEKELAKVEAAYRAAFRRSEALREARNRAVREALAEGWTQERVSQATGLTRGRINQIKV
jgi:hypothetical protein